MFLPLSRLKFLCASGVILFACTGVLVVPGIAQIHTVDTALQEHRREILSAGKKGVDSLPLLVAAMKESNAMIRRAAVRSMGEIGLPAWDALVAALKDEDMLTRRTALNELLMIDVNKTFPLLAEFLDDSSELIRSETVERLLSIQPRTPEITALLKKAQRDKSPDIRNMATQAIWNSYQNGISLRDEPQFQDTDLKTIDLVPISKDGWYFLPEATQDKDYTQQSDDHVDNNQWKPIKANVIWKEQVGSLSVIWIRCNFTLFSRPAQTGSNLVFKGCNQGVWLWVNGKFVGKHTRSYKDPNLSFSMDVSQFLSWRTENQITLRIIDQDGNSKLWLPAYLEVLKQ